MLNSRGSFTWENEGNRCPFLLEHDESKIITSLCNYYSLGQAELARALLHIVASRNLSKALRILKTIIWFGPPRHWLCSVSVPSSAHLAWLCLIDFRNLVEKHAGQAALLPDWLIKRLEFDVLIAQALLDGAAIQAQVMTAEVASELRAYHAGLLCATHPDDAGKIPELQVPNSFKLPALSLLPVTTQVSPYVNFLPAHSVEKQEQLEHFSSGNASLSKAAIQQLYDLSKSQPLLGHFINRALAPEGCPAAIAMARRIQQMCLGLTADALLNQLKDDAWRYLKFLEVTDGVGIPPALLELFSVLLIAVISNVRPTPALHNKLQALVSMSTSTSNAPEEEAGLGVGDRLSFIDRAASNTLAEIFSQAMPAEGGASSKPWVHLRAMTEAGGGASAAYGTAGAGGTAASRSSAVHFSKFLNRMRGEKSSGDPTQPRGTLDAFDENFMTASDGQQSFTQQQMSNSGSAKGTAGELMVRLGKTGDEAEAWETEGPVEAARIAFLYRTKIYEAFLTHESGGSHTALRLFSVLEDEFLRLKSAQSPLPPAFEVLQPLDSRQNSSLLAFETPPITFWDAYFEFTRVVGAHCLEYVVHTAVNFIQAHDFITTTWLLAPFPQLKPLVILLCWPEFEGDVQSRQSLLDLLWKSYSEETKHDSTKTGDLLVDYWVEVLDYRLSVSWWISKVFASQEEKSTGHRDGQGRLPSGVPERRDDPRGKDETGVDRTKPARDEKKNSSISDIAAEVLSQVTSHSILYVMRPNLPMVQSGILLSALQSLPPLRQAMAALEHSYDLDLTRCYYTVRCAMFLVERCVHVQARSQANPSPGRQVIEDSMKELDRLISSIERTPLKVSVFLLISSLCFVRTQHLEHSKKKQFGRGGSDFLVPPSVLLSLLSLLRHHIRPLVARSTSQKDDEDQLMWVIVRLYKFTQETIWRIFIGLKDFFAYSRLSSSEGSMQLKSSSKKGVGVEGGPAHADTDSSDWARAIGAVIVGDIELIEFFKEILANNSENEMRGLSMPEDAHPFLQFCTPTEVPLSLQPSSFIPRMLSGPVTLLHRSLKMNDYVLSGRLLRYFPALESGACESTVKIAMKFAELRHRLVRGRLETEHLEEAPSPELLETQLGDTFEDDLKSLVGYVKRTIPSAMFEAPPETFTRESLEELTLLSTLNGPLLAFYVLVDLAVSAAPSSELSTHLLKKGSACLGNEDVSKVSKPAFLPISDSLISFFQNWIARLSVLVEARTEFKGRASLASIILGIETLPSEPALLKSHLNRLHSQRHAIMSLVESVDLVKKGQTSASQRTLADFLSSAIKTLTNEEKEGGGDPLQKDDARPDDAEKDDAEQMAEGLGASRYLLRFLEYLTKVADLMRSASLQAVQERKTAKKTQEVKKQKDRPEGTTEVVIDPDGMDGTGEGATEEAVEATKLFDVLAESPKGIVARLLFELGGHKQAFALSEVMNVDLVEVIVNSSWVLPVESRDRKRGGLQRGRGATGPHYPMSMKVVRYLAQLESPLPQVRVAEAPLLATMACLERRGRRWPSWRFLVFSREQSQQRFPSLHRWIEERCHALRAIQWAERRKPGGVGEGRSTSADDDESDDDVSGEGLVEGENDAKPARGYTEEELQKLGIEDQLALEAIGDDHEAAVSAAYTKLVNALMVEKRFEEALQVCDEYLPFGNSLTDQVLHLHLQETTVRQQKAFSPFVARTELLDHECMYRLKKHTLAARLTLQRYKRWDVDTAIQTVSMCLQRIELQQGAEDEEVRSLKLELKRILKKMVTFEKILQVSGGRWQVWQEIENMEKQQVSDAIAHLLDLHEHDLARTLTQMYGMTDPLHSLELSRLHYLFTNKNDKTSAVNRLLSFTPAQAVSFALQLLDMFDLIHHRVLLCRMLLTRLHSWLSPEQDDRLRVLHASLQLLGTVSETMQAHFPRLLRKPLLIVESLLMNARVDLLTPFLADFPEYRRDELILRYARKALALSPDPPGSQKTEERQGTSEAPVDVRPEATAGGAPPGDGRGLGGKWCLAGSDEDAGIRQCHVFESAPSIVLAEQILELCSDQPHNAASCFDICNELSLRLYELTPQYSVGPGSMEHKTRQQPELNGDEELTKNVDNNTGTFAGRGSGGVPLSSVRLVTFLIRRLLVYLQGKFKGAGEEIQVQLDRSLNNLDFVPLIWQISGHKVGLSQLCNPQEAAQLRDQLIREDHLSLALELCERCGGAGKTGETPRGTPVYNRDTDAAWHISADPVREAKAVALLKLHRHSDARHEFSQTESSAPHSTKMALSSFENSLRYPPLYDLASLEHLQSLLTFNSIQRKIYRSTAPVSPLPLFLFPGGEADMETDMEHGMLQQASAAQPPKRGLLVPMAAQRDPPPAMETKAELTKLPIPKMPVIPMGQMPEGGQLVQTPEDPPLNKASVELRAMEERLRTSVQMMHSSHKPVVAVPQPQPVEAPVEIEARDDSSPQTGAADGKTDDNEGKSESIFSNAIAYLYPPIHPPELPSWAMLHTQRPKSGKALAAEKASTEASVAEEVIHTPRNPPQEDKERTVEEDPAANETEVAAENSSGKEEQRDVVPDIIYDKLIMDATRICSGCVASQNLRSQSNLWPEDNHTHNLMPASPMALPLAVPLLLPENGERQLSEVAFNELLHYQENYGTAESLLSMLVREQRLSQACYYIFNEKVSKRLFVDVVAHHCLAHNQFYALQRVILDFDPSLRRVQEYLDVLKDFLRNRRALDLLYSYQVFTKDYVNAGLLAIQLFIASSTWDARVGHLQNAFAHLSVAQQQLLSRNFKKAHHSEIKEGGGRDGGDREDSASSGAAGGTSHGSSSETMVDGISGLEITEADIRRNLETVRLQMAVCEAMPTEMPHHLDLFGPMMSQCEVAERLLVAGHFDLAQRVIDFLDLPAVELCVRASNQIATAEARASLGSITPVVKFLEAVRKLPPVEWDSLVSNVINIWIIEKAELKADPSAAGQLIKFIQDERCRMDAHVLTGNLVSAFQIAQRLGNLQDVLHIRSCAQKVGDQELLKQINSFLAYAAPSKEYLKKNLPY